MVVPNLYSVIGFHLLKRVAVVRISFLGLLVLFCYLQETVDLKKKAVGNEEVGVSDWLE